MNNLEKFKEYSETRLRKLRARIGKIDILANELKTLAVYVCGSYARLDAHEMSDLDPFFVNTELLESNSSEPYRSSLRKSDLITFWAEFIKILRELGFAELTGYGQYLEVHELQEIRQNLGSPKDDFTNQFTARMLLLLESRPLYDNCAYKDLVTNVIDFYFKDYHGHEKDFRAIFLLNDIIRYWKTMCLNYENKRELTRLLSIPDKVEMQHKKAEVHLKNLKLKFSRLLTCYSMAIPLVGMKTHDHSDIRDLVNLTPIERIEKTGRDFDKQEIASNIVKSYETFLIEVAKNNILELIAQKEYRSEQFNLARDFSNQVYEFLTETSDPATLRYMII